MLILIQVHLNISAVVFPLLSCYTVPTQKQMGIEKVRAFPRRSFAGHDRMSRENITAKTIAL